jgi:hypothetical protein
MYRQQFLVTPTVGMILVLISAVFLLLPAPVLAQCGEPPKSSCMACHEKEAPVAENGQWHVVHASKDICLNCHGGNASTMDTELAHEGLMAQPLADIYTDCHSCHPDYEDRAAQFAPTLQITPGSCATPTPVAVGNIPGGPPPGNIAMPSDLATMASLPAAFLVILGEVAALSLFLLALGWLARHAA